MNTNNLYFHIHYCNQRPSIEHLKPVKIIKRIINHHELLFVTGNSGDITIENKKYPAKKGMLFYLNPDTPHSIETEANDPLSFLSVHFSLAHVEFSNGKWNIRSENEMLPLQPMQELKDYYQIENIFKKLVESWILKLPGYEIISKALLQQLLFEALENVKKQYSDYPISLKVEKIIKYLHKNINNRVTLSELSEFVQLSSTYLSRIFKETTGYSVIQFFNKLKIEESKELIIEGDKKVKEVAQMLGFTDEFYFSRIFKKFEGISPSEFYSKNVHGV